MIDRAMYKSRNKKFDPQMRLFILNFLLIRAQENDSKNRMSLDHPYSFKEHGDMKRGLGFLGNPFLQNGKFKQEPLENDKQVHVLIVTRLKCS